MTIYVSDQFFTKVPRSLSRQHDAVTNITVARCEPCYIAMFQKFYHDFRSFVKLVVFLGFFVNFDLGRRLRLEYSNSLTDCET